MSVSRLIGNQELPAGIGAPGPHLWTVDEYHRLGDKGFFGMPPHHVELLEGVIYDKYAPDGPAPRKWTRRDYYRMAKLGFFGEHPHVELIEGDIFDKVSPQASPHTTSIRKVSLALEKAFGAGHEVRYQFPVIMADESEPEPDVVALAGPLEDYIDQHPRATDVLLLVEVADSSLTLDRGRKAHLYAGSGIEEYWIVNIRARQIEVFHSPARTGYLQTAVFPEGESLTPLHAPAATILVDSLPP